MPTLTTAAAALPPLCFARHPSTGGTILIIHGEAGFHPVDTAYTPEQLNAARREPPSREQVAAMLAGSLFGWDKPIADPVCHAPPNPGDSTAAPVTAIPDVADWGGPGTPFRLQGCAAIRPAASGSADPLWTHAGQNLGFYGWLRVASRHAMQMFHCGLLELPPRDWLGAYVGRVPPEEAADIAVEEHIARHGTGRVAAPDPLPPAG